MKWNQIDDPDEDDQGKFEMKIMRVGMCKENKLWKPVKVKGLDDEEDFTLDSIADPKEKKSINRTSSIIKKKDNEP